MAKKKKTSMRDKVKQKAEKNMNRGGSRYLQIPADTSIFKPKKGPYNLDFLPYEVKVDNHPEVSKGDLWYQRTYFVHFNVGDGNEAAICLRTVKKPCPICEHVKELYNSDAQEDNDLAKELKAKERELYNIIDLDDQDKGVQLFDMSYHLFGKALDEEINEGEEELADFAELEGGKTLVCSFRKKKLGTNEFFEVRKIDFEDRDDYDDDILEEVYDLDSLLNIKDYETLQKELYGVIDEDDDKDEEEEEKEEKKSKTSKTSKKRTEKKKPFDGGKKKSKVKDEEEDEDEDENEEEKPSKGKKGKKKDSSKGKSSKKNKCPHGGTFGEDNDQLDECEDCEIWVECEEASEEE